MKKLLLVLAIFATLSLSASPIGEQRAREIAERFFSAGTTRSAVAVEMAWAGSDLATIGSATRSGEATENATLYIYNRADKGGFVVVAGDDNVEKMIVAYSREEGLDCTNMPDAAKEFLQAWSDQIAEARRAPRISATTRYDIRDLGPIEALYETARWGQNSPYNGQTPTVDGKHCATGCVATAMAIFCHYYKWPERCDPQHTFPAYTMKNGNNMPAITFGTPYDYDNMLMTYKNGYSEEQANAVAQLMWECGRAAEINYGVSASGGSTTTAVKELIAYFGYSKGGFQLSKGNTSNEEWYEMLKENLKAYGPMLCSGYTASGGGHAFILDGCTSDNYFHWNFGWGGNTNGWYLLSEMDYHRHIAASFYMEKDVEGTSNYRDMLRLESLWDESLGNPVNGIYASTNNFKNNTTFNVKVAPAELGYDKTGFNGKLRLAHCDKANKVKNIVKEIDCTLGDEEVKIVDFKNVTLTEPIEDGDCLRVLYASDKLKDKNGEMVWSMCLGRASYGQYGELFLRLSPEACAESLSMVYSKTDKNFLFESRHTIQYSITNSSGKVIQSDEVAPLTEIEVDVSEHPSGTYTFSFATGGEPHKVTIKF